MLLCEVFSLCEWCNYIQAGLFKHSSPWFFCMNLSILVILQDIVNLTLYKAARILVQRQLQLLRNSSQRWKTIGGPWSTRHYGNSWQCARLCQKSTASRFRKVAPCRLNQLKYSMACVFRSYHCSASICNNQKFCDEIKKTYRLKLFLLAYGMVLMSQVAVSALDRLQSCLIR